jgi:hypothetical protein
MHAYLIAKLATAVQIARYVEGGVVQLFVGAWFEPAKTPRLAKMLAIESNSDRMPDNGPGRRNLCLQDLSVGRRGISSRRSILRVK